MTKWLSVIALSVFALGCKKEPVTPPELPADAPQQASATPPSGGGGVAPIGSGAAGGMTPVTGAEGVGGGGMGGLGSAAKRQAQGAAGMAGGGSMAGATGDE